MNFLKGRITTQGGTPHIEMPGFRLSLDGYDARGALEDGRTVELGIRPEHLEVGDRPGSHILQVEMVEPMGSETLVWCRLGDHPISVLLGGETDIKAGAALPVSMPARRLNLFDADSGIRL